MEASTGTKTQVKGGDKSKAEVAAAPKIDKSQKSAPQEQTGSVSNASALNQTLVASVSAPVPVPVAPVNVKAQAKSDASKDSSVLASQLAGTSADPTVLGTLQQSSTKQTPVASPNVASKTSEPVDATNFTEASNAPAQTPAPEADKSGLTLHADHDPAPHAAYSAVAIGGVHAQMKAEPSTSVADQADTSMRKDLDPRQVASQGTGSIPTPAALMANGTSVPASQATNSVDLSAANNAAAQSASSAAQAATPPAASATPSATKAGTVRSTSVQGLAQRTASRTQPSADAAIHDAQVNIHPGAIGAQENNPTLLRDAANLGGGNSAAGSGNSQSTNAPTTFTAHDTFNALDGDTGAPNTTWIHAGPRHAEAGYLDPTLGWVGVRADSTNGTLHASLVPGSADAAQTLSGHLEGLNRFLNEQQGTPATVTLSNLNSQQTGQFGGQGMGQGSTPNQGNAHNGASAQQTLPGVGSWRNAVRDTSTTSTSAVQALNTTSTAQTNGRISVIA